MTLLVSVIIPTGRPPGRSDLARAVRSALAQSWPELDVWIVDDCSDPPAELPPDLAGDPRVHLIRLPDRVGPAAARNLGVARSHGEVIAFLDDDDAWLEDKTARQLEVLRARDVAVVTCAAWVEDWSGRRCVDRPPPEADVPFLLLSEFLIAPSTAIVRRSAFDRVGGFDESLLRIEDWDLWLRLSDHYAFACLDDVLVLRELSPVAPDISLQYSLLAERKVADRVRDLPHRDRDRVRARILLRHGCALARLGQGRSARRAAWEAWSLYPNWRAPAYLARTWLGEAAWRTGRRARDLVTRGSRPGPAAGSALR